MADEELTLEKWHRKMAVDLFNNTWSYLDKKDLTGEEKDAMVNSSHASRYHWGVRVENGWDATPINLGRGDWQLSRVYAVLGDGDRAIHYGRTYLDICEKEGIKDWDLAYAYEALARGYKVKGDRKNKDKYLMLAKQAMAEVEEKETREMIEADLKTI
ncbi:MAG: hypothetical protein ACFE9D_11355 [Promethearchaeota archaeon]